MSDYDKVKEWREKNPDKVAAQARRYRAKHPDKVSAIKKRYRENNLEEVRERERITASERRKNDPEAQKRRNEAYRQRKIARQLEEAGRPPPTHCELCGEDTKTVFDHCHTNGHFRGWICDRCNRVLGAVYDNIELLYKMIQYLEVNNGYIKSQNST